MKSRIFAGLAFALTAAGAEAENWDGNRMIYGAGTTTCGSWTAERKSNDWYPKGQWMLGYITAISATTERPMQQSESLAFAAWVDNYCAKYPLKQLYEAVQELVQELAPPKT
jgi:hypothetical protein